MAHPQIAAFARLAEGGARATRKIEGQKSRLGRTMHGIVYNAVHDEFVVPQQFAQAILTFDGAANGEVAPKRIIQGPKTMLTDIDRLDLDPVHGEIFVPLGKHVLVFPSDGNGDVAPLRILRGPEGENFRANALAVDPVNNLLVVATGGFGPGRSFRFMIFDRTAEGNAKPLRVIGGPNSRMRSLGGPFAVYPPTKKIVAGIRGGGAHSGLASEEAFVGVWSLDDDGDVPPHWTIGGPHEMLRMPRGIALDPKNKNLIMTDKRLNAILTYHFPEIF